MTPPPESESSWISYWISVIGEALRRLVGSVVIKGHKSEAAVYCAPARNQGAEGAPRAPAQPVEAAQLGVRVWALRVV